MEVEIYLDKQLADITFEVEALDEWKQLAGSLGLENQLTLTKGKESPIPYPWMNTCMVRTFETLCPTKVDFKDYNKTPIPLEILKQISFTIKDKHFNKIEIWYDDKSPDPAVIGLHGYYYVYDSSYRHAEKDGKEIQFDSAEEAEKYKKENKLYGFSFHEIGKYLIARWGDVKRDFNELKKIAIEKFVDTHNSKLKSDIAILTQKLGSINENAKLFIEGEISFNKATTVNDW